MQPKSRQTSNHPTARQRHELQVAGLSPTEERAALDWIEAVSEFDEAG